MAGGVRYRDGTKSGYGRLSDAGFMGGWDQARGLAMEEGAHRKATKAMIKSAWNAGDMGTVSRLSRQGSGLEVDFSISNDGTITVYDGSVLGLGDIEKIADFCPWVLKSPADVVADRPETPEEVRDRVEALEALKRGDAL